MSIPSPYIKTYLVESNFGRNRRDIYSKKKTKIKKSNVNPIFEETLEYFLPFSSLRSNKLEVNPRLDYVGRVRIQFLPAQML